MSSIVGIGDPGRGTRPSSTSRGGSRGRNPDPGAVLSDGSQLAGSVTAVAAAARLRSRHATWSFLSWGGRRVHGHDAPRAPGLETCCLIAADGPSSAWSGWSARTGRYRVSADPPGPSPSDPTLSKDCVAQPREGVSRIALPEGHDPLFYLLRISGSWAIEESEEAASARAGLTSLFLTLRPSYSVSVWSLL